ncbi:tyrosine-protein phosphatase [Streptomyces endophyticus]|uniref:Tyrosine-protein phosphatase n=1 Tax=Streptomyces endophyticus TaxID=714166 RepID=A0ABU6F666_9ACTN|nr:tyrosine-protein phosphatase [Streptomyces endophyticus]MEB8339494.1 tyrosine-protein phosphatase [Streptomyces endophyticus]
MPHTYRTGHADRTDNAYTAALSRRRALAAALGTAAALTAAPVAAAVPGAPGEAPARPATGGIRQIPLKGAVNVRDIGGYRARGHGRVRYGLVYRADALSELTDADVARVAGLRLGEVVDFRVPFEVKTDGADRLPAGLAVTSRSVSDGGQYEQMMAAIGSKDPAVQQEALGNGKAAAAMRTTYRMFVTDAANRAQFAATLRDAAYGGRGALLYHCTSGKDRTGWMTYVLLSLLGVSERDAVGDYLASNTFRAAHDAQVREGLRQAGLMRNPELLIPVQEVRMEYLDAAREQVRSAFGSLDRYVAEGLGVDRRVVKVLRARLVE